MARMKKQEPAPAPTSLVASAARIRGGFSMGTMRNSTADHWHEEVWRYYDAIGEFRYACDWIGAQLSKALIYGTVETADGIEKVVDGNIPEYLSALFGNADGRAEMFRLIGIHMSVTGECYIVGYPDPDPFGEGGDKWEIAASTKCVRPATDSPSDSWKVNDVVLTEVPNDKVLAIRLWRPHPKEPQLSTSPAKAIRTTLHELYKLSQHVSAQIDSRLAGAGILLMPSTMGLPTPPATEGPAPQVQKANNADDLMKILMEAMARSIQNRDDASAIVPIVVTASAEDIAAVKHLTFWSELDEKAIELRKEAIGRLALGMDMPPEVLQGVGDSNHWSAWQADESAIKSHTEPLLKIITTGIAKGYLRPLLSEDQTFDGERLGAYSIGADTSEMRLRPNRSKEAMELHALGVLSDEALVRECGFEPDDMRNNEQLATWLTRKVAAGSTTPELVEAALKELGVSLTVIRPDAPAETGTEGRPGPSLEDHPATGIPDQEVSDRRKIARDEGRVPSADVERKASLIGASEQIVIRALERAGNKLKSKMQVKPTCAAADIYKFVAATDTEFLLDDAWSHVPLIAARARVSPSGLEALLADYTAKLLTSQEAHSFEKFSRHLHAGIVSTSMEAAA